MVSTFFVQKKTKNDTENFIGLIIASIYKMAVERLNLKQKSIPAQNSITLGMFEIMFFIPITIITLQKKSWNDSSRNI